MEKYRKVAPWLTRLILVPPTVVFALIASRYLLHPMAMATTIGLAFTSPLGVTIVRVGFGAFPLGCSLFTLSCLLSRDRLLTGLGFVTLMMALALVVRVFGMLVDHTVSQNMGLVGAEAAMLVLMGVGVMNELGRRRTGPPTAAASPDARIIQA